MTGMEHDHELTSRLRIPVQALLKPLFQAVEVPAPTVDSSARLRIASLSELIALARSHVERDRYSREVVDAPVTEGNTRLPQQLAQIARGSALLDGRSESNEEDLHLVRRAALDSLQPLRRAVLGALLQGRNPSSPGLAYTTVRRGLEDL